MPRTPEEKRIRKAEKGQARMERDRERRRRKANNPANIQKEQERIKEEVDAIHNVKHETEQARKVKERLARKSGDGKQVGLSATNRKWESKRKQRYQERVWKGWDTKPKASKVVTYNINDLQKEGEKKIE